MKERISLLFIFIFIFIFISIPACGSGSEGEIDNRSEFMQQCTTDPFSEAFDEDIGDYRNEFRSEELEDNQYFIELSECGRILTEEKKFAEALWVYSRLHRDLEFDSYYEEADEVEHTATEVCKEWLAEELKNIENTDKPDSITICVDESDHELTTSAEEAEMYAMWITTLMEETGDYSRVIEIVNDIRSWVVK